MEKQLNSSSPMLVAGHVVIDEVIELGSPPREALGGPISYSAISLSSLGYKPEVVTRFGDDFPPEYSDFLRSKSGVSVEPWRVRDSKTTRYRIDVTGKQRKMWLASRCQELAISDFRAYFSDASHVRALIVNPVAGEVSLSLLERLSKEFDHVFVDSQGFVRRISKKTGEVSMRNGLDISSLAGADTLKADADELRAWVGTGSKDSAIRQISRFVNTLLVTSGAGAVELYEHGQLQFRALPFKVAVADTIGAGDILLSSFAARLTESSNNRDALAFAVAAGALSVRNHGIEKAFLSRAEVEQAASLVEIS